MYFSGDIRAAADIAQCDMKPGCPANLKQTVPDDTTPIVVSLMTLS